MTANALPKITIYTDGGCNPNPGPGGWAAILLHRDGAPQELSGGEPETTNNRMELRAAIEGLNALSQPYRVTLHTDSQYLRRGITQWLPKWISNNWLTSADKAVKNKDLWQALHAAEARHEVTWQWTKGHAGDFWNERADQLATEQIPTPQLPLDDEEAIHIFTGAAYSGKTKTGGWGVVLRHQHNEKCLSGTESNATGNRMHVRAAVAGLQALKKDIPIHLYTNSDYLKDGATSWVKAWAQRNWKTKQGKAVSHRDLWEALLNLSKQYSIRWHVVSKEEMPAELEQAKALATAATRGET